MLTLPIVAGRRYVRRDGVTVTAREKHASIGLPGRDFVFVGEGKVANSDPHRHVYVTTGRIVSGTCSSDNHVFDLVADAPALTLPLVIGKTYRTRGGLTGVLRAARRSGADMGVLKECAVTLTTGRTDPDEDDEYDVVEGPLDIAPAETTAYPHAALMLQYAQDAAETDKPWDRWQSKLQRNSVWSDCSSHPRWRTDSEYRRKPTTRTVTLTLPEPLRTAPAPGTHAWMADAVLGQVVRVPWTGSELHQTRWLAAGLLYATESEAAQFHHALLGALR